MPEDGFPHWQGYRVVDGSLGWELNDIREYYEREESIPFGTRIAKPSNPAVEEVGIEFYDDRIEVPAEVGYTDHISVPDEYKLSNARVGPMYRSEWPNVEELLLDCGTGPRWEGFTEYRGDPRPVIDHMPRRETALQQEWEKRRRDGRFLKVIIAARDGQTGVGKTMLAVELAKSWDDDWSVDRASNDPQEFLRKWRNLPPGSVLIGDEAEQMADARRSMASENLDITHAFATLRYRQVSSILTLPDASNIDVRLRKAADFIVMVHDRGEAVVYRSKIEDGTGKPYRERCHKLTWDAIDEDEDYQNLEDMKADRMENYEDEAYYKDDEDGGESAVDPDELRRDGRDEVIREMAADGMTQKEIGEIVGLDRTTVSKIVNADG